MSTTNSGLHSQGTATSEAVWLGDLGRCLPSRMGPDSPVTGGRLDRSADVLVEAGVRQWCMDVLKLAGSNGYSPAQHILYLHFNSLSHRYGGLTSRIQQTTAPCGSQAPTQSREATSPSRGSTQSSTPCPSLGGTCHIYGSVCASKGTRARGLSFRGSRLVASTGHAVFYVSGNLLHSNAGSCRNYDGWNGAPP